MYIACSTLCLRKLPFADAVRRIADAGFAHVEPTAVPSFAPHIDIVGRPEGEAERAAKLLSDHGLQAAGLNSVPWIPDALDDRDELLRRYTAAADAAVAIGAPIWVVDGGQPEREGDGHPSGYGKRRWQETVAMAAELAAARGLTLAVESPHRGTLSESVAGSRELIDSAGIDSLRIDYDTSHIQNSGTPVAESIAVLGDRIGHVALRDALPDGSFCVPGDGGYDYAALIAELKRIGYTGPLVIELETPGVEDPDQVVADAVRTRELIESLLG